MVTYWARGPWQVSTGPAQQRMLCFFVGLVITFLLIRVSVRLVRAGVRWWPGNIAAGGTHIHHVVFGVVAMALGGVVQLAASDDATGWRLCAATLFGVGTALVLDEFALILHLRDVYWSTEGRLSVDAIFLAIGLVGLLLLGARPLDYSPLMLPGLSNAFPVVGRGHGTATALVDLAFAVVALAKGKVWTGLLGLLFPPLAGVGALRLARPDSPWARWWYRPGSRKLVRAVRREARYRQPLILLKIRVQELISGRHDLAEDAAERGLRANEKVDSRS
ncbi:MAG: hypothetical protein JOZ47_12360 [Kutzneria sp.]|nr:hypothetical protein [Kutzneria sp.]MBV9845854.1 hypothetical protein [Kutzneria sp.]